MNLFFEIFVIFLLLVINGLFAMAEIAVVSARPARLKGLADRGDGRARAALALARHPTRFLSTVQIGITLVGILAGAFGGATLSGKLSAWIATFPPFAPYAPFIGIFVVVGAITYFSLIIGELVPKRIALANPEGRAMLIAKPMTRLSRFTAPAVSFLTVSTNLVLKVFGLGREIETPPSADEISNLIEQGTSAGVFHHSERAMVEGVLRLDERPVTEIMTRRARIVWINVADDDEINWRKIVSSGHSHFPVYEGSHDHVLGMISVKSLWANASAGLANHLRHHLTRPLVVPETIHAGQLLESFKKTGKHLALVTDEFGGVQGLVTLIDVMEAIVGDLPEPGDHLAPEAVRRDDGTWLVDGSMLIGDLRDQLALPPLPGEEDGDFTTLAGFMLDRFGHIPRAGEHFTCHDRRFEVVDMDRHRVDKVLIGAAPPAVLPASEGPDLG